MVEASNDAKGDAVDDERDYEVSSFFVKIIFVIAHALIIINMPAARNFRILLRRTIHGYKSNIGNDPEALAALHDSKNALQAASSPIKLIQNGVHIWSRMLRNNYRSWNLLHVPSLLAIVWDLLWRLLLVGLCVI